VLGIEDIATYVPERTLSNLERGRRLGVEEKFIRDKIGIDAVSRKEADTPLSELCARAFERLRARTPIDPATIDVVAVVAQNPDAVSPHTAAIVHRRLGLGRRCASFDVNLACSGFPYGLTLVEQFMARHGLDRGLLFCGDAVSDYVDEDDRDTSFIFGDAATVTLVSTTPRFVSNRFRFGTLGDAELMGCRKGGRFYMHGRGVFGLVMRDVCEDLRALLDDHGLTAEQVDRFVFHQPSKYVIDNLAQRLKVPAAKVPWGIRDIGNTAASSLSIVLEPELRDPANRTVLISGFGSGFSWASTILTRAREG
jgi:3-oxoacyl-[acyl-carrier-protein] synthase III